MPAIASLLPGITPPVQPLAPIATGEGLPDFADLFGNAAAAGGKALPGTDAPAKAGTHPVREVLPTLGAARGETSASPAAEPHQADAGPTGDGIPTADDTAVAPAPIVFAPALGMTWLVPNTSSPVKSHEGTPFAAHGAEVPLPATKLPPAAHRAQVATQPDLGPRRGPGKREVAEASLGEALPATDGDADATLGAAPAVPQTSEPQSLGDPTPSPDLLQASTAAARTPADPVRSVSKNPSTATRTLAPQTAAPTAQPTVPASANASPVVQAPTARFAVQRPAATPIRGDARPLVQRFATTPNVGSEFAPVTIALAQAPFLPTPSFAPAAQAPFASTSGVPHPAATLAASFVPALGVTMPTTSAPANVAPTFTPVAPAIDVALSTPPMLASTPSEIMTLGAPQSAATLARPVPIASTPTLTTAPAIRTDVARSPATGGAGAPIDHAEPSSVAPPLAPDTAALLGARPAPAARTVAAVALADDRIEPSLAAPLAAPIAAPIRADAPQPPLDLTRHTRPTQMVDRIERLRDAADAVSTSIRVIPDALGAIDVSVRKEGEVTHVHLAADQPQTRALLAEAAPKLAELAEQRGIKLGQNEVGGGSASTGGQQPAPQQQTARQPAAPARAVRAEAALPDDSRIA